MFVCVAHYDVDVAVAVVVVAFDHGAAVADGMSYRY